MDGRQFKAEQPQLLDSVLRRRASWPDKYAGGKTVFNQVRRTAQQNILDVAPLPEVWSPGHASSSRIVRLQKMRSGSENITTVHTLHNFQVLDLGYFQEGDRPSPL